MALQVTGGLNVKTVFWDIECTDLDSKWARLLTVAFKTEGKKPFALVNKALITGKVRGRSWAV